MGMTSDFVLYQHHLPDEVRVFRYARLQKRKEALVADGVARLGGSEVYCRSYMFLERWLQVFAVFDSHFKPKDDANGPFPFAFNCDVTTPHYVQASSVYTTDIALDILVASDGCAHRVVDETAFNALYENGLFGECWREKALRERDEVVEMLEQRTFLNRLNDVAPFPERWIDSNMPVMERGTGMSTGFKPDPRFPRYANLSEAEE